MRQVLALAVGIVTWFLLDYLFTRHSGQVRIMPGELIQVLKVVRPQAQFVTLNIVPWLITAIIATRNQIVCVAIAAACASAISSALLTDMYVGHYPQLFVAGTILSLVSATYGAAAGALGARLARSNNSFKPKPLRGSA